MSNKQAACLIVENIQYLEQAKKLLEGEITENLHNAVDTKIRDYIEGVDNQWSGVFNFYEENNTQFAPESWRAKDGTEFKHQYFYARYFLGCESDAIGGDGTEWWLSTFLKNDVDHMVFNFYPWIDNYLKCTKKDWKIFANEKNQIHPEIEQLGFKYNATEGAWYLIIEGIDPVVFIENYENDSLEDALAPIIDALNKLEKVHPFFNEIVQKAITKFGRIENEE
ncbi:hypothetical protein B9T26_05540 [Acinetobacter sp. ANC 4169]|uniref:hypothetical protein n=1 Tax=Acinetobacter sp. ANC 4169 TaxID=1977879 RepID=UPI000A349104|nr:hypothetical protein [Acinetobacter sp. ANC 4169]OTG75447.1 hypothetical protein B9T26_05540 [Acinetobacter sp. ANC 4169]